MVLYVIPYFWQELWLDGHNAKRQRPNAVEQFLWYKERSDTTKIAERREVHDCVAIGAARVCYNYLLCPNKV